MKPRKPEVGAKYGRLTIVVVTDRRTKACNKIVVVQCDCGSPQREVSFGNMKPRGVVSCGCLRKENRRKLKVVRPEIGDRFGKFVVVGETERVAGGSLRTLVRCDCGSKAIRKMLSDLVNGRAASCRWCAYADRRIAVGDRFGRLVVIGSPDREPAGPKSYLVRCDCGSPDKLVYDSALRSGDTKSCGCLNDEKRTKHGMSDSKVYRTWASMVQRTTNPKVPNYPRYGGRGITANPAWVSSFDAFYADMGDPPTPSHSLHRKNNDGNYCKENCVWATSLEQMRNTRTSIRVSFGGRDMHIEEVLKKMEASRGQLSGWKKRNGESWQAAVDHFLSLEAGCGSSV